MRKAIKTLYFGCMYTALIAILIFYQTSPGLQQPPTSHISNHLFYSLSIFLSTEEVTGTDLELVSRTEKTYYFRGVYTQGHNSTFQIPGTNSWSDLVKKNKFKSALDSTSF